MTYIWWVFIGTNSAVMEITYNVHREEYKDYNNVERNSLCRWREMIAKDLNFRASVPKKKEREPYLVLQEDF